MQRAAIACHCRICLEYVGIQFAPSKGGKLQVVNTALDVARGEEPFVLPNAPSGPLAVLAFKLEEGKYGQLTYVRVYSGVLRKGSTIVNVASGKKHKVPRLVRTHSDELEDVNAVQARHESAGARVFPVALHDRYAEAL